MITIKEITTEQTWPLRQSVMWPGKDISFVQLPDDHEGIHYGLFIDQELVSVVSLFIKDNSAQFRKFATQEAFQNKGYGSQLLQYILQETESRGVSHLWCNARKDAQKLYHRFGFEGNGQVFEKEGIPYEIMTKVVFLRHN